MMHLISLYFFTFVTIIANGKKLKFYSNFIFENLVYGPEDVVVDYSILADDPIGNLPETYTVCSSVFIKFARCSNKMTLPGTDLLYLPAENMTQCQRF